MNDNLSLTSEPVGEGAVLVIGGGIAGVQASLDLAESGARVILVERGPSIGGKMAALDKNFPTLDCSICIEAPKLSEVAENRNIEILSNAEVLGVEGEPGHFVARIRRKETFVTSECTRCDLCSLACPVVMPSEFEAGMASRKAIYTPFPQAVPGPYVLDVDQCLNDPPNYLPCGRCVAACPPKCIDFNLPLEQVLEREVASVVVATGFELMNPLAIREYGYGTHPDILTSLEFERLLGSAGPTGGEIIKPSTGEHPHSILFVLCVGSRDERFYRYCSRFCCMYSVKQAFQAIDHGVPDVSVLYMDIRAYGKGFDAFYERTRAEGAHFIRGRPSRIAPNETGLEIRYENTELGQLETAHADMVILATAVRPPSGLDKLAEALSIELDEDGFLRTTQSGSALIGTTRPGVYVAGCASGPKDIPDSVSEASGAAAAALTHVSERAWPEIEAGEPILDVDEMRAGVFLCDCGSNIAGTVDVPSLVKYAATIPGVVHAEEVMFACAGNTQQSIADTIVRKKINRLVVAACSPKTHEGTFRRVCVKAGLNSYLMEMVNLRNQSSWVHKTEKAAATQKALDMVRMGVEKARHLTPLTTLEQPMIQAALVVGGGVAGMAAAANLARQGYDTHLIEQGPELGGTLKDLSHLWPDGGEAAALLQQLRDDVQDAGVLVYLNSTVDMIGGHIGDFWARLTSGQELRAGAVVLATGAEPYKPTEFGYGEDKRVITNLDLERNPTIVEGDRVTFVGCVGSRADGLGCSRYCCQSMIGQALELRRQGKQVRVAYRDIRTFSRHAEELYEQAMREGVQFFRYDPEKAPRDVISFNGTLTFHDHLLDRDVDLPTDQLVLTVGMVPRDQSIAEQLKVARSEDGFLLERHPKLGPAEAGSPGIFLAGAAQAPKDVRDSLAQGLAAAAKAGLLLARDVIEKEPIVSRIAADPCSGCGLCVRVCPFGAIEMTEPLDGKPRGIAQTIEAACEGCGTCAAACNFDAIEMPYFTDEQIMAQIDAALVDDPADKVLTFACNWCSYAGADQAGIEKIQYPTSARIIRTMCSGRLSEKFVSHAFQQGAGAVLVTGCRIGDCHYINANHQTLKRFELWKKKFARQGIENRRLQLQWISASQGKEFAAKMREMHAVIQEYSQAGAEGEGACPLATAAAPGAK